MEIKNARLSIAPVVLGLALLFVLTTFVSSVKRNGFSFAWQSANRSLVSSDLEINHSGNGIRASLLSGKSSNPVPPLSLNSALRVVNNVQSELLSMQLQSYAKTYK